MARRETGQEVFRFGANDVADRLDGRGSGFGGALSGRQSEIGARVPVLLNRLSWVGPSPPGVPWEDRNGRGKLQHSSAQIP
jgi:hypothetical protein